MDFYVKILQISIFMLQSLFKNLGVALGLFDILYLCYYVVIAQGD